MEAASKVTPNAFLSVRYALLERGVFIVPANTAAIVTGAHWMSGGAGSRPVEMIRLDASEQQHENGSWDIPAGANGWPVGDAGFRENEDYFNLCRNCRPLPFPTVIVLYGGYGGGNYVYFQNRGSYTAYRLLLNYQGADRNGGQVGDFHFRVYIGTGLPAYKDK